jgi:type II secretory pathway component PulM
MKNLLNKIVVVIVLLFLTACEFDPLNNQAIEALERENKKLQLENMQIEANRSRELEEHSLAYKNQENLAKIAMQKTIAEINQVKELEALRLKSDLEKEQINIQKMQAQEKLLQDAKLAQAKNELRLKQYLIALGAFLLLIIAFFIFYYFKKRREDKLRAYNDNLDKYFRSKENEARVKIAEKILDTISSGNLSAGHEARLIEVFNADKKEEFQKDNLLTKQDEDDVEDAVIVEK